MVKKIFIINGSGGVGKDTFVSMVSKLIKTTNYSSIEYIKSAARIIGYDGTSKDEKSRKFLSDLKLLSSEYNDHPYKMLVAKINEFYDASDENEFLFLHVREPKEIRRLKKDFPEIITILITNKNVPDIKSNNADLYVMCFEYNITINNDEGLLELNEYAQKFVDIFGREYDWGA